MAYRMRSVRAATPTIALLSSVATKRVSVQRMKRMRGRPCMARGFAGLFRRNQMPDSAAVRWVRMRLRRETSTSRVAPSLPATPAEYLFSRDYGRFFVSVSSIDGVRLCEAIRMPTRRFRAARAVMLRGRPAPASSRSSSGGTPCSRRAAAPPRSAQP